MTYIKIFEGFEHKIKWKISQTRTKEGRKKHGRKLWRARRSFGKTQPDGEAWSLYNSPKSQNTK